MSIQEVGRSGRSWLRLIMFPGHFECNLSGLKMSNSISRERPTKSASWNVHRIGDALSLHVHTRAVCAVHCLKAIVASGSSPCHGPIWHRWVIARGASRSVRPGRK